MKFSKKYFWALSFGILVLSSEISQAKAEPSDKFYHAKKVVITANVLPWTNRKEVVESTAKLESRYPLLKTVNIQQIATDYVSKHLDEKIKKCIEVVSPDSASWNNYISDYQNLLMTIKYDFNETTINGKPNLLVSMYLQLMRPRESGGLMFYSLGEGMATQSVLLSNDPSQIQKDFTQAVEHVLEHRVNYINASNRC